MRPTQTAEAVAGLAPDMLANIQARLSLLDRFAFTAAFGRPESPWLVLPGDTPETATLFSLADRRSAVVRALDPDHLVLGSSSSRGWLVTADDRARLRLVNPVTGERRALPAITTIPCVNAQTQPGGSIFSLDLKQFIRGPPPYPEGAISLTPDRMRRRFYRKVVLSNSAAIAMLITDPRYGAVAFASAESCVWRLAPSRHGVAKVGSESVTWPMGPLPEGIEDAVYHAGRFYSITCSGEVETWEQDADVPGVFTSTVVEPGLLPLPLPTSLERRKYLVVAPGGRLMVVVKESKETTLRRWTSMSPSFKVHVLDGEGWKDTDDIGDTALFVGVNGSLCMSTKERSELRAGCVYYTEDAVQHGRGVSVQAFSLKDGIVDEEVEALGPYGSWPQHAWFTPSFTTLKTV